MVRKFDDAARAAERFFAAARIAASIKRQQTKAALRASFGELALEPDRHTRRLLSSYVVGHRRRLPPPKQASEQARARAHRVRITLRPGETWVTPHVRGGPGRGRAAVRVDATGGHRRLASVSTRTVAHGRPSHHHPTRGP